MTTGIYLLHPRRRHHRTSGQTCTKLRRACPWQRYRQLRLRSSSHLLKIAPTLPIHPEKRKDSDASTQKGRLSRPSKRDNTGRRSGHGNLILRRPSSSVIHLRWVGSVRCGTPVFLTLLVGPTLDRTLQKNAASVLEKVVYIREVNAVREVLLGLQGCVSCLFETRQSILAVEVAPYSCGP